MRFGSLHDLPLKAASVALPNNAARKHVLYNCVFIPDIPLPQLRVVMRILSIKR